MRMHGKKHVLFVCFANANRSQLAEAFAHLHGGDAVEVYSAGVSPATSLDERAVAVILERGCDPSTYRPKALSDVPQVEYDAVVTMGCEERCPKIATNHHIAWDLPQGKSADEYAALCDAIEGKVKALLANLR